MAPFKIRRDLNKDHRTDPIDGYCKSKSDKEDHARLFNPVSAPDKVDG